MILLGYLVPKLFIQIAATVVIGGGTFFGWLVLHDRKVAARAVKAEAVRVETKGNIISEKAHNARAAVPATGNTDRLRQPTGNCRDC